MCRYTNRKQHTGKANELHLAGTCADVRTISGIETIMQQLKQIRRKSVTTIIIAWQLCRNFSDYLTIRGREQFNGTTITHLEMFTLRTEPTTIGSGIGTATAITLPIITVNRRTGVTVKIMRSRRRRRR